MDYLYPTYRIDFTREMLEKCCHVAVRLVDEEGMVVRHDEFLDAIHSKPGVTVDGRRVRFDKPLVEATLESGRPPGRAPSHASARRFQDLLGNLPQGSPVGLHGHPPDSLPL